MNTTRPFSQALRRLRGAGLRPTRQRLALAKLLFEQGGDRHVTAEALHEEASGADVRVSLATVYNTFPARQTIIDLALGDMDGAEARL